MLMQNFGVTNKEHYGMLRYFLEWSIEFFFFLICLPVLCGTSLYMYPSQSSTLNFMSLTYTALIDLIYVTRHLCTRLRTDGIKAVSRGFSGGKQVINFPTEEIAVAVRTDGFLQPKFRGSIENQIFLPMMRRCARELH